MDVYEKYDLYRLDPKAVAQELIDDMVRFIQTKIKDDRKRFQAQRDERLSAEGLTLDEEEQIEDDYEKDLAFIPSLARTYQWIWLKANKQLLGQS